MSADPLYAWRAAARRQARGASLDRLQPALLDRLVDDHPQERREARGSAMITELELRAAVLRDLRWLLNTVSLEATDDLRSYSWVRESSLNFGVRALAGKRMSEIDWADLEVALTEAIVRFEPRILPESLAVRCMTDTNVPEHYNVLSLSIRGRLWCVPHPLEFLFRSDIDLESGHIDLLDLGGA